MSEKMNLFDGLIFLGNDKSIEAFQWSDLDSIRKMLDKYGIQRALMTSFAAWSFEVEYGNRIVFDTAAQDDRLIPCPTVLPNTGLEVGDETEFIDGLIKKGARCVCFYPEKHGTGFDDRVIGKLFKALEKRRLPVALREPDLMHTADCAARYPNLPFILHAPPYRNRMLLPVLEQNPNIYLSLRPNFSPLRGLEVMAERIGAQRLLFATGYPEAEPGAALSFLLLSELGDEDVSLIASGNLARLVDGVAAEGPLPAPVTVRPEQEETGDAITAAIRERKPIELEGVIDMHAHYGRWVEFPMWYRDGKEFIDRLDRVGIARTFVSRTGTNVPYSNDRILDLIKEFPDRVLGYAVGYPDDKSTGIDEIKRCFDRGMSGIKMHSSEGIPYDDKRFEPIWEFADKHRLPVLLHTWGDLDQYERVFKDYSNAQILAGHAGSVNPPQYVEFAGKYKNIILELCFSHSRYGLVEYFVREVGAGRVVWGSDMPWMDVTQQIGKVAFADISAQDKELILAKNAKQILDARK